MKKSLFKFIVLIIFVIGTFLLVACGQTVIEQENDLEIESLSQNYYGEIEVVFKNPEAVKYGLEFRVNNGEWQLSTERLPNTYALMGYTELDRLDLINKKITIDVRKVGYEDEYVKYKVSPGIRKKAEYYVKPCLSVENLADILVINEKQQSLFDENCNEFTALSDEQKKVLSYTNFVDVDDDLEGVEYFNYAIMIHNGKLIFKRIFINEENDIVYFKMENISEGLFKIAPTDMISWNDIEKTKIAYDKAYEWIDVESDGVYLSMVTSNYCSYNDVEYCYYSFFVMINENSQYAESIYYNLRCLVIKTTA